MWDNGWGDCTAAVYGRAAPALSQSLCAGWKLFGLNPFDLCDFVTSNLMMPLGGIALSLFFGWGWAKDQREREFSNHGRLANSGLARLLVLLLRFVSPLLIAAVMIRGLV